MVYDGKNILSTLSKWTKIGLFWIVFDISKMFEEPWPRPQKQKPNSDIDRYWTSLGKAPVDIFNGVSVTKNGGIQKKSEKSVTVSNDKCRQTTTSTLCNTNLLTCLGCSQLKFHMYSWWMICYLCSKLGPSQKHIQCYKHHVQFVLIFQNLNLILCPWCQAMPSCSWNSRSPSQGTWPAASSS